MNAEIEKILKAYNFVDSEYSNVFAAMSEILDLAADKLGENQPNAYNGIARLRDVARNIYDMEQFEEDYFK